MGWFKEAIGGEYVFNLIPGAGAGLNFEYIVQVPIGPIPWLEWDSVDRYPMQHGYGRQDIRLVDDKPADCGC